MVSIKEIREKSRKPYWSFSQRLRHELGYPLTKVLLLTPITPNMITVFWILLGFVAAYFVAQGTYLTILVGVLIFNFSFVFDAIDGQVARFKNRTSFKGYYLDKLGHTIGTPLFYTFLGHGVFIKTGDVRFTMLGLLIAFFHFVIEGSDFNGFWPWRDAKKFSKEGFAQLEKTYVEFRVSSLSAKRKIYNFILELFKRSQPFNVLFILVVFDKAHIALIIYALLFAVKMVVKLIKQLKALEKIDKDFMYNRKND